MPQVVSRLVALTMLAHLLSFKSGWRSAPDVDFLDAAQEANPGPGRGVLQDGVHKSLLDMWDARIQRITVAVPLLDAADQLLHNGVDDVHLFGVMLVALGVLFVLPYSFVRRAAAGTFLAAYLVGICQDVTRCQTTAHVASFIMLALCLESDGAAVHRCAQLALGGMWTWAGVHKLNPRLPTSDFSGGVGAALDPVLQLAGDADALWGAHAAALTYAAAVGELLCGLVVLLDACGRFPSRRTLPHLAAFALFVGQCTISGEFAERTFRCYNPADVVGLAWNLCKPHTPEPRRWTVQMDAARAMPRSLHIISHARGCCR
jgi:hypothetical protein